MSSFLLHRGVLHTKPEPVFEDEESLAVCRTQMFTYWLLLEPFWNSHPDIPDPLLAGLPYLFWLSLLWQFLLSLFFSLVLILFVRSYVHPKIIWCSAKNMYKTELYKTAIFISQKQSNFSKFTWFSLILWRSEFTSQFCHSQLCEFGQITHPESWALYGWEVAIIKLGFGDSTTQGLSRLVAPDNAFSGSKSQFFHKNVFGD